MTSFLGYKKVTVTAAVLGSLLIVAAIAMFGIVNVFADAPTGTANLWVNGNGSGSCFRQTTPGSYNNGQGCVSFEAAYNAAQSGDTINVVDQAGGNDYGAQTIPVGTKTVTFRGDGSSRPEIGQLIDAGSNVTVKDLIIEDRGTANFVCPGINHSVVVNCAPNQTFENIVVDGLNNTGTAYDPNETPDCPREGMGGDDNLILKDSVIQNIRDAKGMGIGGDHIYLENNVFQNIQVYNYCYNDVHNECIYASGVPNATFKRNKFIKCPTMSLFFTNYAGGPNYSGITLENNVFGHTVQIDRTQWHPSSSVVISTNAGPFNNWRVVNNTFEGCVNITNRAASNSVWANNIGCGWGPPDCISSGVTYSHNVAEVCGGSDTLVTPHTSCGPPSCSPAIYADYNWVDPANNDWHLGSGSVAIDGADPTYAPTVDLDGNTRSGTPDAGAFEFGATSALIGDFDSDSDVDSDDLDLLKIDYGKVTGSAATPAADLNSDGKINILDLSLLLRHWTG